MGFKKRSSKKASLWIVVLSRRECAAVELPDRKPVASMACKNFHAKEKAGPDG
jgi:hypothetical protein